MKQLFILFVVTTVLTGCQKQNDWLNEKRQTSDVVPKTLADFQALLDNTLLMNANYPTIGLLGCDNYYFPDESIPALNMFNKNTYYWNKDIFGGQNSLDYSNAYNIVSTSNIVLENLPNIDAVADVAEKNNIHGQALFYRSLMFYELSSAFCKPYVKNAAAADLGICVRLKSNIYHIEPRSSVQKTFDQIVEDARLAATLLPATPMYKTRPSKPAAFAMLARAYLLMEEYAWAKNYADSCLAYFNGLLDFNGSEVSLGKTYRFPGFNGGNNEIIFYATGLGGEAITANEALNLSFIDSTLYKRYDNDDLRKIYFYDLAEPGKAKFRGTYTGTDKVFSGIASNEVYFIRAECNARAGNTQQALADLNRVLIKRYATGKYREFSANDPDVILAKVLEERRKEFPFTGQIRWQDLRRLNRDPRFSVVLFRNSVGNVYQLKPNDPKYVYPLPQAEVEQAGLPQNER